MAEARAWLGRHWRWVVPTVLALVAVSPSVGTLLGKLVVPGFIFASLYLFRVPLTEVIRRGGLDLDLFGAKVKTPTRDEISQAVNALKDVKQVLEQHPERRDRAEQTEHRPADRVPDASPVADTSEPARVPQRLTGTDDASNAEEVRVS